VVEVEVTFTAPSDWGTTVFYRNTTNNSGTATEIERGKKKRIHDQSVSYGSTYYYWAKVADRSGNLSGFSPSSSHSITVAQIVTADVGSAQIGGAEIKTGSSGVATTNIAANAVSVIGLYSNDGTSNIDATETEVGTITVSTDGGATKIEGGANVYGTDHEIALRIRKDSTSGSMLAFAHLDLYGSIHRGVIAITGVDASPSGSQVYKLTAQRLNGSGTVAVSYRRLTPAHLKR
jgi:hypothetical protein